MTTDTSTHTDTDTDTSTDLDPATTETAFTTDRPAAEPLAWSDFVATCTSLSEGAFMATTHADGRPHLAWVMPGFGHETMWIATFRNSQKAVNLANGSDVAMHWLQRPDALVLARATARLVDDPAESSRLWDEGAVPYDPAAFFGTKENPLLLFVELTPTVISISGLDPSAAPRRWVPAAR